MADNELPMILGIELGTLHFSMFHKESIKLRFGRYWYSFICKRLQNRIEFTH